MAFEFGLPDEEYRARYAGLKALWIKVIIRAMFDWASYKDSVIPARKKFAETAYTWLFNDNKEPFSFIYICSFLDIEPEKFRKKTLSMTKAEVAKVEFKERKSMNDPEVLDDLDDF
jgi:hypothetical protein